jgi:hypothetical protein
MSNAFGEASIASALARDVEKRAVQKAIEQLLELRDTLSGDDFGLQNIWEEICVQVQDEQSLFWDTYEAVIRDTLTGIIEALPDFKREALWMQSDAASEWKYREPRECEQYPVNTQDAVEYLFKAVCESAGSWSNDRIRRYLERSSMVN